jgi:DNA polymerase III delta prime subunit
MADSSQEQKFGNVDLTNSKLVSVNAGGDAIVDSPGAKIIRQSYWSLFGDRATAPGIDWDWAMQILRQQQPDIKKRLKDSLFGLAEVDAIEMESKRQEYSPALALEAKKTLTVNGSDAGTIDPQAPIIATYAREDIDGSLLILGTPGAGKTITLLKLAEQLVGEAIAQPQTVIPIIFELSTWRDGQEIEAWLIEQLYENHGGNRKQKIYEMWVERRVLLPLLDGLDELGLLRQQACTKKVNEFAAQYRRVVVCCRVKEFQQAGVNLSNLRGKVQLQPLSDWQLELYLQQMGKIGLWDQIQSVPEMGRLLEPVIDLENADYDEPGLLRVPLFISLAARVFEADRPLKGKADLFDRYIDRQLSFDVRVADRRKELKNRQWSFKLIRKEPEYNQVKRTLSWMAVQLQKQNQVELLPEKIQPIRLEEEAYSSYTLLFGILCGVTWGAILGFYSLKAFIFLSMILSFVGTCFGRVPIRPVEAIGILVWPKNIKNRINEIVQFTARILKEFRDAEQFESHGKEPSWALLVVSIIIICFLVVTHLKTIKKSFLDFLMAILVSVLFWILREFIAGFRSSLKSHLYLNQSIVNSFKSMILISISIAFGISLALFLSVFFIFLTGVLGIIPIDLTDPELLLFWSMFPQNFLVVFSLIMVVWGLPLGFLFGGGVACIQYLSLRVVLTRHYKIPWNLARFLTYCHERRLLQQIGGRYRFIHRELLDHFANQLIR